MISLEVGAAPRAALVVAAILRSRVSAIRSRVRVFSIRYRFGPAPVPEPEDPYLIPDQPRPET